MKKCSLFFFFQLIAIALIAQRSAIDSLKGELIRYKEDSNKVYLLAALSNEYLYSNPDSALLFAQEGYYLSQQLSFKKGEALCLNRMANPSDMMGNSPKALHYLQTAIEISSGIDDYLGIVRGYNNVGDMYMDKKEYAKALPYFMLATTHRKDIPIIFYSVILQNIGNAYYNLNNPDSSSFYLKQAYNIAVKINDPVQMADILRISGDVELKKGNRESALNNYRTSFSFLNNTDEHLYQSKTLLSIGQFYQAAGNSDSCIFYSGKALKAAQTGGFTGEILNASQTLANEYQHRKQFENAFLYYKISMDAKDSIFSQEKVKQLLSLDFEGKMKQQEIEATNKQLRDRIKIYSLMAGLLILLVLAFVQVRNNRQKQKAFSLLQQQKKETDLALKELEQAQAQLIQAEKMASLGELTSGIAHEIQNPLNFVNNFSEVNQELAEELKTELAIGNQQLAIEIANDIKDNSEKINHHGKRADAIVKGMLQHSSNRAGVKEQTDINSLADEYLRLAYHGVRAKDNAFNATMKTDFDESIGSINIIPQDIGRVLLNLYNNAFYAVNEKFKAESLKLNAVYEPTISVTTKKADNKVSITVSDNGNGIPQKVVDKIFQPFFTTKPTGVGTGLGLSLSYDIIRAHGGEIKVGTKEGEGTTFIIQLPIV